MLHITDTQVAATLNYAAVTACLELAFQHLAAGQASIHARQRSACGDIRFSSMGAVWPAKQVAGIKVYPTVAGRFGFSIVLFDLRLNAPMAVLDGAEITRLRTAAIAAMVASRAARRDARRLALFGAGYQGRAQAQAFCERFDLQEICVVDPLADAGWCSRFQEAQGVSVRITTPEEAVRTADLVVTATRSAQPVFDGDWLREGAFVAAIGTSSPGSRELDDTTMRRANRIIVEWKPQSLQEAGELALWSEGRDLHKVVDLCELFGDQQPWRGDASSITVFKSVGVGLSDVATAYLAASRLLGAAHADAGVASQ